MPAIGSLSALLAVFRLVSRIPSGAAYHPERAKRHLLFWLVAFTIVTSGFAFAGGNLAVVAMLTIAHYHALYATALAVAGKPLVAAFNAGASFGREVPVFDDPRLVRDESRGRALAAVVAKGNAAVLRGHGAVVVAKDIVTCVALALQLEESARRLWLAYAVSEPRRFTDAELESVAENLGEPRVVRKIWIDALERARLAGAMTGIDTEKLV